MNKINQLLNKVWETSPKPRKLKEGEFSLFQFSDWKGYAWLDGIMNAGDFSWTLETARMFKSELGYENEWAICNHVGIWIAQSKGLATMLEKEKAA